MAVTSNVAYSDFPDVVVDTSVNSSPVLDVFRGTANVVYIEATNASGSALAYLQIYDHLDPTIDGTASTTTPVFEAPIPTSGTLRCSCLLEFTNGVSYAAVATPGGYDNPAGTVTLTLIGAV